MKKLKFYVCPQCGNILTATAEAAVSCCGKKLAAMQPVKAAEAEKLAVEHIENELFRHKRARDGQRALYYLCSAADPGRYAPAEKAISRMEFASAHPAHWARHAGLALQPARSVLSARMEKWGRFFSKETVPVFCHQRYLLDSAGIRNPEFPDDGTAVLGIKRDIPQIRRIGTLHSLRLFF